MQIRKADGSVQKIDSVPDVPPLSGIRLKTEMAEGVDVP